MSPEQHAEQLRRLEAEADRAAAELARQERLLAERRAEAAARVGGRCG